MVKLRTPVTDIRFTPVMHQDLPLLKQWMDGAEWRRWWGDPETEIGYVVDMIEGRDTSRPFLFHLDGQPAGYIQYWFIGDHQTEAWIKDHPWLALLPADAVGVDLSIGDPNLLSRGLGSAVLQAFVSRLVADGWRTIIIDPDPANARAVRAYEKAGFRAIPELLGKTGDCLIMSYQFSEAPQEPQLER